MGPIHLNTPLCDPTGIDPALVAHAPALPDLIEPDEQPPVLVDNGERLVSVLGPRVTVLPAYYEHGLPHSLPFVLARETVAARLHEAAALLPDGFGFTVLDAWRPLALQHLLYQAAYADPDLPPGFVSEPSRDPTTPPPHLTGGTVDLTLSRFGQPLALGSKFDEFRPLAHTSHYEQTPGLIRDLRRLLVDAMRRVGFIAYRDEWWHFELGTRRWAALTGNTPWYRAANLDVSAVLSVRDQASRPAQQHPSAGSSVTWDCLSPVL